MQVKFTTRNFVLFLHDGRRFNNQKTIKPHLVPIQSKLLKPFKGGDVIGSGLDQLVDDVTSVDFDGHQGNDL